MPLLKCDSMFQYNAWESGRWVWKTAPLKAVNSATSSLGLVWIGGVNGVVRGDRGGGRRRRKAAGHLGIWDRSWSSAIDIMTGMNKTERDSIRDYDVGWHGDGTMGIRCGRKGCWTASALLVARHWTLSARGLLPKLAHKSGGSHYSYSSLCAVVSVQRTTTFFHCLLQTCGSPEILISFSCDIPSLMQPR